MVFENVPSYPVARDVLVQTSRGSVSVGFGFGSAFCACVEASALGLSVVPEHYDALLGLCREIKWALNDSDLAQHPDDDRLRGICGTIVFDNLGDTADGPHQRNVTVSADGPVDCSPCGSDTATWLALLADSGRLCAGQTLTHDSIVGTRFLGRANPADPAGKPGAIMQEVEEMAYMTGEHMFTLDPADPVGTGLELRLVPVHSLGSPPTRCMPASISAPPFALSSVTCEPVSNPRPTSTAAS